MALIFCSIQRCLWEPRSIHCCLERNGKWSKARLGCLYRVCCQAVSRCSRIASLTSALPRVAIGHHSQLGLSKLDTRAVHRYINDVCRLPPQWIEEDLQGYQWIEQDPLKRCWMTLDLPNDQSFHLENCLATFSRFSFSRIVASCAPGSCTISRIDVPDRQWKTASQEDWRA